MELSTITHQTIGWTGEAGTESTVSIPSTAFVSIDSSIYIICHLPVCVSPDQYWKVVSLDPWTGHDKIVRYHRHGRDIRSFVFKSRARLLG